jgi:CRP/FNR family transcriptional regulator, cyclic AMP receptor protein
MSEQLSEIEYEKLRKSNILAEIPDKEFQEFLSIGTKRIYHPGQVILTEGKICDDILIIISGKVDLFKTVEDTTKPEFIRNLSAGESLGEIRLVKNHPCALTVISAQETTVLHVPISVIKTKKHEKLFHSLIESGFSIITQRLLEGNENIVHTHRSVLQNIKHNYLFILFIVAVLFGSLKLVNYLLS